ncbi:MAG: hypothetical protein AAB584_01415, partial [Patescibacteria group bacterium]
MPGRVNLGAALKTASKFALLGIFVFVASSSIFAFAKNDDFKNSLKKIGQELTEIIIPSFKFTQNQKQITFTFGSEKFLDFKNLADELNLALYNFQSLSKNYSANLFDTYLSPLFDPLENILGRLFGKEKDTAELNKQIEELKKQFSDAHFKILGNEKILEEKIKEGLIVQENQVIRETKKEKTTVTERKIVTIPSNVETRLLSVERLAQGNEQKFKTIELTLASIDNRFSYTPTILVPSGGGGGSQGVTISNPPTTDSNLVKAVTLDVSEDATITRHLTVDTNTFYVNAVDNRVGIGTRNLDTALEIVGTASISGQLLVNGTGNTEFGGNVSVSGNFEVGTNKLYVDSTNGRVGVRTQDLTTAFEVQGTASASYLLTGNTLQVGGYSSTAYSRFGTNTTSYSNFISTINDLLVSGNLEVDSDSFFDANASLSGNFELTGSSPLFGINAGNVINNTFEVGGTASISGNAFFGSKASISSNLQISGRFIADTAASHSFAGDLAITKELTVSGEASNSFSGSLDITKGLRAAQADFDNILVTTSGGGLTFNGGGTNTISSTGTLQINAFTLGGAVTGNSQNITGISHLGVTTASISGNFQTAGRFIFGDGGDTGEINTSDWDISNTGNLSGIGTIAADGAYTQTGTGANTFSGATTFSATGNTLLVSAGRAEVQGTASASYLLTGNTIQVGGFSSAAYSRFGTDTTSHTNYITTTNDLLISGDLEVNATAAFDSHVAIGDATDGTDLVAVNAQIRSHLIPFSNIYDVGSTANRWRKIWTDSLDVTNLTAASSSISGTVADAFTVNSDNVTSDTEDSSVTFERGNPSTNAVFKWDATNNRFDFNFPVFLQTADPSETSVDFTKLILKGTNNQVSNDYFEIQNKNGSRLFIVESDGRVIASSSFQAGGNSVASVSYSRFGTATTGYSSDLDASNDLLISGALEVDGNSFFDGKASISGNFQTAGRFIFGDGGDTGEINTSDWDISNTGNLSGIGTIAADGAYTQTGTGANTFSGATTFSATGNTLLVSAGRAEVQGTASASYLLTGNTIQVGGFSSAAYSRFGTDTTSHTNYITTTNDLLISGDLEVNATAAFDSFVTISNLLSFSGTTHPGLRLNNLTTVQRDALTVGAGTTIFNTTDTKMQVYNGTSWKNVGNPEIGAEVTSGTAGSVLFVDASGNLGQNNANFYWDVTNAKLGIGTSGPSTKFEVQGTASASYLLTGNTLQVGGFSSVAYNRFGTATTGYTNFITTTNDVLVSGDLEVDGSANFDTFLRVGTNNTPALFANASTGNVGVGTTSPLAPLHVLGQCVTGDTRLRRKRSKKLKVKSKKSGTEDDDYDEIRIDQVKPGDEIASLDEKTGKIVYRKVKGLMDMGVKPIYKLTTASGKAIRTTGNHPYLVKILKTDIAGFPVFPETKKAPIEVTNLIFADSIGAAYSTIPVSHRIASLAYPYTLSRLSVDNPNLFYTVENRGFAPRDSQVTNRGRYYTFPTVVSLYQNELAPSKIFPNQGKWTKVALLQKGDKIAVTNNGNYAVWDAISNIELLPPEQVYDIEVEGTHNFIGNNIVAHNTFITGNTGIGTTSPTTRLEVIGTASASNVIAAGAVQFANPGATVSYSRFGTATTGYSSDIDASNDLLISGALEVDGNSFFDGKASISGNFQTAGRFIFGDNGDTGEINTSDWDITNTGNLSGIGTIAADGAYTQTGTGANTFSGATTFSSTGLALLVSAGRAETQGTASASYLLTGNTLQVGGFSSAAYNRFGTNTTNYSRLADANDLLITDDLEVDGTVW